MTKIMHFEPIKDAIGVQVIHRETGNNVEEPLYFEATAPIKQVMDFLVEYIMEGNEMTEQEVRATYRFEVVL